MFHLPHQRNLKGKPLIKPLLTSPTGHYRMQAPHHNQGVSPQHGMPSGHQKPPKPISGIACHYLICNLYMQQCVCDSCAVCDCLKFPFRKNDQFPIFFFKDYFHLPPRQYHLWRVNTQYNGNIILQPRIPFSRNSHPMNYQSQKTIQYNLPLPRWTHHKKIQSTLGKI